MLLLALILIATPPKPHALIDSAIAAMQRTASLRSLRSLRLTGIQHEYVLGNAERAEGPFRTSYSMFSELRDLQTGASRRTDKIPNPNAGAAADRVTILVDSVVAIRSGARELASSHAFFEDIIDRIDGSPERALTLAAASSDLKIEGTAKRYGLTYDVVSFPWRNGRMKIELSRETRLPDAVEIDRRYDDNFRWNIFPSVTMRMDYLDWNITPSGALFPLQVRVSLNGEPLRNVTFSSVLADAAPPAADSFAVSDSARIQYAANSKLNFSRFAFGARGEPKELKPGIVRVVDQWVMTLVKQPDGVVVFESHISGRYFRDVVAEVNRRWPGSRIKAVVLTSDPWGHLGGFREVVSMGYPVYVSARSIPFLTSLAKGEKAPKFVAVSGKTTIGTGENRIELYPVGGPYAERMVMAYFPDHRLLYGADLVFMNRGPDGKPSGGFMATPAEDLRRAVARERLVVDSVFCVQNYGPFAWSEFAK